MINSRWNIGSFFFFCFCCGTTVAQVEKNCGSYQRRRYTDQYCRGLFRKWCAFWTIPHHTLGNDIPVPYKNLAMVVSNVLIVASEWYLWLPESPESTVDSSWSCRLLFGSISGISLIFTSFSNFTSLSHFGVPLPFTCFWIFFPINTLLNRISK